MLCGLSPSSVLGCYNDVLYQICMILCKIVEDVYNFGGTNILKKCHKKGKGGVFFTAQAQRDLSTNNLPNLMIDSYRGPPPSVTDY